MSRYQDLATTAQLDAILADPRPQWLFKHSNACSISTMALEAFESYLAAHPDEVAHVLVIQEARPLSAEIAQRLNKVHQSPQVLLIVAGQAIWSASHWSITPDALVAARSAVSP